MIDRAYTRTLAAFALVMLTASTVMVFVKPGLAIGVQFGLFAPAAGIAVMWGWMRLWLWLSVGRVELNAAMGRFCGRVLVAGAIVMAAVELYALALIWSGPALLPPIAFLRLDMLAGALIWIIFGNVIPKLPYQQSRNWIEIGPAYYYRLNRFSGWLMVASGIAIAVSAFAMPPNPALLSVVFFAISAALLLFIGVLAARYRHSFRCEAANGA